jgi:hypothetical protein
MTEEKKLNEAAFAKIVKEISAHGELIRTRQNEKQAVLNHFRSERQSYLNGKISRKAFESSVRKVNKELSGLDSSIRKSIKNMMHLSNSAKKMAASQSPRHLRATMSGIKDISLKKKRKK